ncbi:MAG: hypothetical protein R3C56_27935 [Pirellulaceae bacterium]
MPFAVTSFGAARIGDAIYIYGGHTGKLILYPLKAIGTNYCNLDLNAPSSTWENGGRR